MTIIRGGQPIISNVTPHNGNSEFIAIRNHPRPLTGNSFVFAGTGKAVTQGPVPASALTPGAFAVQVYPTTQVNNTPGLTGCNVIALALDGLQVVVRYRGAQNYTGLKLLANQINDVSARWDGSNVTVNVNGAERTFAGGTSTTVGRWTVADANPNDANYFAGAFKDLRIYSDEAMTTLTNRWLMTEGENLTFLDSVGTEPMTIDANAGAWQ